MYYTLIYNETDNGDISHLLPYSPNAPTVRVGAGWNQETDSAARFRDTIWVSQMGGRDRII